MGIAAALLLLVGLGFALPAVVRDWRTRPAAVPGTPIDAEPVVRIRAVASVPPAAGRSTDLVYCVTKDTYHTRRDCPALKGSTHTVEEIPLTEAGSRRPCSRCR